ncbi:MAG: gamma-glutamyl-gamma-aminobutyrate hydrolase family protein [Myxococcota bacterium]|nr:gamma-glutamyl-gamma-aminobutyrate hydrolase family protein [Myxococcota bacterium]
MGPLIGIPPCLDEQGRWRRGRSYHYLDRAYADAVAEAGGSPVYLPEQPDLAALVQGIDGLLVPGGDDFLPEGPYPETVRFDPVGAAQLAFDTGLLAAALGRGIPVLGICYGMQLLVRHHGGTLLYDIATDRPGSAAHQLPEPDGRHAIAVTADTRLAAALGEAGPRVNSLHHQGVAEPGARLRATALAEDGLIEAVEDPERDFCIGVQWHPEKMDGPHRARLFGSFVAACRR